MLCYFLPSGQGESGAVARQFPIGGTAREFVRLVRTGRIW